MILNNKVVVITGAGGGLGRALSSAFVKEGALVIGLGRDKKALETTLSSCGASFSYYQVDISDFKAVETVVQTIVAKHKRIDFLFNNAAVYPKLNFLNETADAFSSALAINVGGVANCCKAVLPYMVQQKFGRVFNVGSWADLSPIANSVVYSASKGAIHALTKGIAKDIEHHQVDVQVHEWIPGELKTQMSGFTGLDPTVSARWVLEIAKSQSNKKNAIFERDHEWLPPKSLKQRIKSKLLFWKKPD